MVILAFAESIQLVPDGTLLLHVAIIITMVFVLNTILYKPISHILSERESRTRGRIEEARGITQRVEGNLSRYENALRQARAQGYHLLEKQQLEASSERQQKITIVRKEIEEQVTEEKSKINAQVEEAKTVLVEEARQVATSISSKILGH